MLRYGAPPKGVRKLATALKIRPHVFLSGPEGCRVCPLPEGNKRVHLELEETETVHDRSEPRRVAQPALELLVAV